MSKSRRFGNIQKEEKAETPNMSKNFNENASMFSSNSSNQMASSRTAPEGKHTKQYKASKLTYQDDHKFTKLNKKLNYGPIDSKPCVLSVEDQLREQIACLQTELAKYKSVVNIPIDANLNIFDQPNDNNYEEPVSFRDNIVEEYDDQQNQNNDSDYHDEHKI